MKNLIRKLYSLFFKTKKAKPVISKKPIEMSDRKDWHAILKKECPENQEGHRMSNLKAM